MYVFGCSLTLEPLREEYQGQLSSFITWVRENHTRTQLWALRIILTNPFSMEAIFRDSGNGIPLSLTLWYDHFHQYWGADGVDLTLQRPQTSSIPGFQKHSFNVSCQMQPDLMCILRYLSLKLSCRGEKGTHVSIALSWHHSVMQHLLNTICL